jgi:filamentous hemagglutinin
MRTGTFQKDGSAQRFRLGRETAAGASIKLLGFALSFVSLMAGNSASAKTSAGDSAPHAGPGGDWPVINEHHSSDVVRQSNKVSCAAACGEMLSTGTIRQNTLIKRIGAPAWPMSLASELGTDWIAARVDRSVFDRLVRGDSWAAELRAPTTGKFSHMVVVDGVNQEDHVLIRDPWEGTRYEMTRKEFLNAWTGRVVFREPARRTARRAVPTTN